MEPNKTISPAITSSKKTEQTEINELRGDIEQLFKQLKLISQNMKNVIKRLIVKSLNK